MVMRQICRGSWILAACLLLVGCGSSAGSKRVTGTRKQSAKPRILFTAHGAPSKGTKTEAAYLKFVAPKTPWSVSWAVNCNKRVPRSEQSPLVGLAPTRKLTHSQWIIALSLGQAHGSLDGYRLVKGRSGLVYFYIGSWCNWRAEARTGSVRFNVSPRRQEAPGRSEDAFDVKAYPRRALESV